jgi:drug/metabolite transporter (DMT)-like permease
VGQTFLTRAYVTLGNARAAALGRMILLFTFVLEWLTQSHPVTPFQLFFYLTTIAGALLIGFGKGTLKPQ